jgi:hypothetical protein
MKITAPGFIAGQQTHPYDNNEKPPNARALAAIKELREIPVAVVQPRILISSSPDSSNDGQLVTSSESTAQPRNFSSTLVNSVEQGSQFLSQTTRIGMPKNFSNQ